MYIKYYAIIMYPICYNDYKAKRLGGANEADAPQGEVGLVVYYGLYILP